MKWLLAIPHYIVLFFLYVGAIFAVIAAWFAILFTGRYPRGIFDYVEGVIRWHNRVVALRLHPGDGRVPAVPAGALSGPLPLGDDHRRAADAPARRSSSARWESSSP